MSDNDFQKLTNETRTFPGPKAFLVSGYDSVGLATLGTFLESIGFDGVAVKCCTAEQLDEPLETILTSDTGGDPPEAGKLPCTMIVSGMTPNDLQQVMGQFKNSGLQRPIFATTTPTNLGFKVKKLLLHLLEEQKAAAAMIKKRKKQKKRR